VILFHSTLNF